jgi:sugar/nucleoside kinase (ribokinase family)
MTSQPTAQPYDVVVVGHLTMDVNVVGGRRLVELGGPPAYAMCLPALGLRRVGIVSCVGDDFPLSYLRRLEKAGLDLIGLRRGRATTHFLNEYSDDGRRTQEVTAVADPIRISDVPGTLWRAQWLHVSPVLQEVDSAIITAAKQRRAKVSVDIQGFVRRIKPDDKKRIEACSWKGYSRIARHIDVLKCDVEEIRQLTGLFDLTEAAASCHKAGSNFVLITDGIRGSYVSYAGTIHRVPAIPPRKTVDHTGCGDVYAMSFLVEYERSQRPLWSAYFAAASASFNVETPGAAGFPNYDEVAKRLRTCLSKSEHRSDAELLVDERGPTPCPL